MCATIVRDGLRRDDVQGAIDRLNGFWHDVATESFWERLVDDTTLWSSRITGESGSFGTSPYFHSMSVWAQRELRATIERYVEFDGAASDSPPHLFVGAVNIESGSFEVFVDDEEGASALLASTTLPNLFRAVEIDSYGHWDGLFSQNPPIRHFTSEVPADQKPDQIWIIWITPDERREIPRSLNDIADRRNELPGDLSLKQEKHMIRSINDLIDEGVIDDNRYKHIELREIELDMELDIYSKLDRSPTFLENLMERGEAKASEFWSSDDV